MSWSVQSARRAKGNTAITGSMDSCVGALKYWSSSIAVEPILVRGAVPQDGTAGQTQYRKYPSDADTNT